MAAKKRPAKQTADPAPKPAPKLSPNDPVTLVGPNGPFTVTRRKADGVYAHFERHTD